MNIPVFNNKHACIVDRSKVNLAAVISSYLYQEGQFLSVFEFPSVTTEKPKYFTEIIDEHHFSSTRSEDLNIQIHNSINKAGGCDHLIIAGLDEKQKSYLTFLDDYNIIEIDSIDEVEACLGGFAYDKEKFLLARPEEVLKGLYLSAKHGLKLRIDSTADSLNYDSNGLSGLIVVENDKTVSAVSAINYALSIDLDIEIIDPFSESDIKEIKLLIEEWQEGNEAIYSDLSANLFSRIEEIDFSKYIFATFFTRGAPFSLILENQIPISYVHLHKYPNIFIIDNIFIENQGQIGSSIVFSPLEFGSDEETDFVINRFKDNKYWVKELIGKEASAHNIDIHVKEYPYDIIHICSHGGEVKGYSVTKEFLDQDGNKHVVEYDDVISFYPERGKELIKVEHKHIWRKFNGYIWKSRELEEKNYPHYVFSDMINAIVNDGKPGKKYDGAPKAIIPDSCAIKCSDFIYQAMFNMVACFHTSPLIFNNTCWSWSGIAESFLDSGARGYIGTLWAVENKVAKSVAETFYQHLFDNTVLNSLHKATQTTKGTNSHDIYIYWGLHFSTLKKVDSVEKSRLNITRCLMQAFYRWQYKAFMMPEGKIKESSKRLADWDFDELLNSFLYEFAVFMVNFKAARFKD